MRIVGIDPAPAKPSTIFDGTCFRQLGPGELRTFVRDLGAGTGCTLVCWDAPLTGPRHPGGEIGEHDFTTRVIEQFFTREIHGWKTPRGISVRGYAGCPHWTLGRAVLGLPRVGAFDLPESQLPLRLVGEPPCAGANVVEVHPALALWLWCREQWPEKQPWTYKHDVAVRAEMVEILLAGPHARRFATCFEASGWEDDDDHLDAAVAWVLGCAWVAGDAVEVLGNEHSGSFLLPRETRMQAAFARFVAAMPDPPAPPGATLAGER